MSVAPESETPFQKFRFKYFSYFAYFKRQLTIEQIKNYLESNKILIKNIKNHVNINSVDINNLNILFITTLHSNNDLDCLLKMKFLIENYQINFFGFDDHQRRLPVYTCMKGFLESTKYILEKMNFDIKLVDEKKRNLFFYALRSFNLNLVNYLDEKYPYAIYELDEDYNGSHYFIFNKEIKKREKNEIKNMFKYILNRNFSLSLKNNENKNFVNLCKENGIEKELIEVIYENYPNAKIENIKNIIYEDDNKDINEMFEIENYATNNNPKKIMNIKINNDKINQKEKISKSVIDLSKKNGNTKIVKKTNENNSFKNKNEFKIKFEEDISSIEKHIDSLNINDKIEILNESKKDKIVTCTFFTKNYKIQYMNVAQIMKILVKNKNKSEVIKTLLVNKLRKK